MTKEEYIKQINALANDYTHNVEVLTNTYCKENNPYKPGDIVETIFGTVKIITILGTSYYNSMPCYKFLVRELDENQKETVSTVILQSQIQKVIL